MCDNIPRWIGLLDSGKIVQMAPKTVAKNLVPLTDILDFSRDVMQQPDHIIGWRIQKSFNGIMYGGYVTAHSLDRHGQSMWGVRYEDGDYGDYFASELKPMLIAYDRPPPLLNRKIMKTFSDGADYCGTITGFDHDSVTLQNLWSVLYDDGDLEDLNLRELLGTKIL
jgi:hypothetical protein